MDPVEIRRFWSRARFDERGVTINRKPPIAWDRVSAVGVDTRFATVLISLVPGIGYFSSLALVFARPCLHLCVPGDRYPVSVPAVTLTRRKPGPDTKRQRDRDVQELRDRLGEWLDPIPIICPPGELGLWWQSQERRPFIRNHAEPTVPTSHERVVAAQHELKDLQHQLDQINRRKRHDLPPS